jgi:DNA-binding PadR family transcriptional regulator
MNPYRHDPCGWRGPRGSYFGRGRVKFAILELLKEKPRHGYDIIREMEDRSGGVYTPSPGVIYPTLQALEDQDFVTSAEQDGKKVYSITEAGVAYLQGHPEHGGAESGEHAGKAHHERPPRGDAPRGKDKPYWVHTGPGRAGRPHSGAAWGTWFASSGGPEIMREMRWMFGDFASAVQRTLGDPEKLKEIREVLREAKTKIDDIVMR